MSRARDGLGGGVQTRSTPKDLVQTIEQRFGVAFCVDLAADEQNKKCDLYFGEQQNSLTVSWAQWIHDYFQTNPGNNLCAWLNPPFKHVAPWMEKCGHESAKGLRIITLTLASIGSNWYNDFVKPHALSLVLRERVAFEGMDLAFNKDLMVSLWGFGMTGRGEWEQSK